MKFQNFDSVFRRLSKENQVIYQQVLDEESKSLQQEQFQNILINDLKF